MSNVQGIIACKVGIKGMKCLGKETNHRCMKIGIIYLSWSERWDWRPGVIGQGGLNQVWRKCSPFQRVFQKLNFFAQIAPSSAFKDARPSSQAFPLLHRFVDSLPTAPCSRAELHRDGSLFGKSDHPPPDQPHHRTGHSHTKWPFQPHSIKSTKTNKNIGIPFKNIR